MVSRGKGGFFMQVIVVRSPKVLCRLLKLVFGMK